MVRFDLWTPPSRSNEDSAKLKSAYNSFITGPRGLEW